MKDPRNHVRGSVGPCGFLFLVDRRQAPHRGCHVPDLRELWGGCWPDRGKKKESIVFIVSTKKKLHEHVQGTLTMTMNNRMKKIRRGEIIKVPVQSSMEFKDNRTLDVILDLTCLNSFYGFHNYWLLLLLLT